MSADEVTELRAEVEHLRQEVEQRTGMHRAALALSEVRRQENNRLQGELVALRQELHDAQVRVNDLDFWIAEGRTLEARLSDLEEAVDRVRQLCSMPRYIPRTHPEDTRPPDRVVQVFDVLSALDGFPRPAGESAPEVPGEAT